jgi:hypothetical protein
MIGRARPTIPKLSVGMLSADVCQASVGSPPTLTDDVARPTNTRCRWIVGGLLVYFRWIVGGLSRDCRWNVGGMSVDCRWIVGRLSVDCHCQSYINKASADNSPTCAVGLVCRCPMASTGETQTRRLFDKTSNSALEICDAQAMPKRAKISADHLHMTCR